MFRESTLLKGTCTVASSLMVARTQCPDPDCASGNSADVFWDAPQPIAELMRPSATTPVPAFMRWTVIPGPRGCSEWGYGGDGMEQRAFEQTEELGDTHDEHRGGGEWDPHDHSHGWRCRADHEPPKSAAAAPGLAAVAWTDALEATFVHELGARGFAPNVSMRYGFDGSSGFALDPRTAPLPDFSAIGRVLGVSSNQCASRYFGLVDEEVVTWRKDHLMVSPVASPSSYMAPTGNSLFMGCTHTSHRTRHVASTFSHPTPCFIWEMGTHMSGPCLPMAPPTFYT